MFSPYYGWSAERDPFAHCAMNVVLYGARSRFAMTERGAASLSRNADHIAIGPSAMHWDGTALTIRIDERGVAAAAPAPRHGAARAPRASRPARSTSTAAGRHRWWPMAPSSRVEVAFDEPGLRWSGSGYFDTNDGDEPLGAAFSRWTWCRADLPDGAAILYDVPPPRRGRPEPVAALLRRRQPPRDPPAHRRRPADDARSGGWPASTRSDDGRARVLATYEDTPFYARSLLASTLCGEPVRAMHESLSLDRFRNPLVQLMLPFRMPRPLNRA